jgi:hypothetical protein
MAADVKGGTINEMTASVLHRGQVAMLCRQRMSAHWRCCAIQVQVEPWPTLTRHCPHSWHDGFAVACSKGQLDLCPPGPQSLVRTAPDVSGSERRRIRQRRKRDEEPEDRKDPWQLVKELGRIGSLSCLPSFLRTPWARHLMSRMESPHQMKDRIESRLTLTRMRHPSPC